MRSSYSLSLSDSDEQEEEDTCQVYWETKSILEQHPNPVVPPKPRPPPPPATTSTPLKPKRSTTAAALPSPSASTTSTKRPLRQPKRTRNSAPETSSQRVDASTLKLVSQLAARFSQRSSNGSTPLRERSGNTAAVAGRTRASNEAGGGAKGKAKGELCAGSSVLSYSAVKLTLDPLQPSRRPPRSAPSPRRPQPHPRRRSSNSRRPKHHSPPAQAPLPLSLSPNPLCAPQPLHLSPALASRRPHPHQLPSPPFAHQRRMKRRRTLTATLIRWTTNRWSWC